MGMRGKTEWFQGSAPDQIVPMHMQRDLDITVKNICRRCNEGWLHDLERAFRTLMSGALLGQPVTLNQSEQRVVASWGDSRHGCSRRCRSIGVKRPYVKPGGSLRYLREHNEPPPGTQVWLGYVADADREHQLGFIASEVLPREPPYVGALGVFEIGYLLFHIYGAVDRGWVLLPDDEFGAWFTPIWPNEVPEVSWPPARVFRAGDLPANWPGRTRVRPPGPVTHSVRPTLRRTRA